MLQGVCVDCAACPVPDGADIVFGPALYRLVTGYALFDETTADAVVDAVMRGLAV